MRKKLLPPWFSADTHPEEGVHIVMWDGLNLHIGVWTKKVGPCGPDGGGFATIHRKVDKSSTTHTKLTLVEGIKCWTIIPDQKVEL